MDHRQEAQRLGRWLRPVIALMAVGALALSLLTVRQPVGAQTVSVVVAVAFTDEVDLRDDLARFAATRLIALLSRKGVQVVPVAQMETALREVGLRPTDLTTLASNETLAHQLGADVVITGRIIRSDLDHEGTFVPEEPPSGPPEAFVTLRLRMMVIATRRISYADVTGRAVGGFFGLAHAADQALQQYVDRWPVTQP
ncbi:MAG: hypothetical protein E6K73_14375 [Candidatus Eisenbacteria bacterium]|uniref:FlgO domain-containing protein n=1 Tax=Eiseniibacteriota bacterium TaxID=2212470 RepID=A0A538S6L6_UNCEI|nr:MAG: hypothetical protein E6K73_14375 [Candidatus Eisenbacteria bacterium]